MPPAPPPAVGAIGLRVTKIANKKPTKRGNPTWKKGGPSPNPAGAPKRGESWAEIIKRVGEYTPPEAAARSLELAKKLLSIGDGVTLKEAAILRVYGAILFEPQPGLLNILIERAEGKVSDKLEITDWRAEAQAAGLDPDEVLRAFQAKQAPE